MTKKVSMTKDSMKEKKEQMDSFYKENMKYLTTQVEYEKLLTEIEKLRAERINAQMFIAQALVNKEGDDQQAVEKGE
jgi:hypothetical protein